MSGDSGKWDPNAISVSDETESFMRFCRIERYSQSQSGASCKGRSCHCWRYLAPHRMAFCLDKALILITRLGYMGMAYSDLKRMANILLKHVWEDHVPPGGTSLDELRRVNAAINFYNELSIPPAAMAALKQFARHKMHEALQRDSKRSEQSGAFPCGAPLDIGEDIEHWRLARMTTRKMWEEAKRRFKEGQIIICQWCYDNAEAEASMTDGEKLG